MSFERTKDVRLFGVTNQNSTVRMTAGDSSGGTFTKQNNPFRGALVWDDLNFVLQGVSVAGGATGGSYTITIHSDAVLGYTGLPIAQAAGIGPNSKGTIVMESQHGAKCGVLPTHIFINQTASGGGIWFQCQAIGRWERGTFGTRGIKTSERVIQGTMLRGTSTSGQFASDAGIAASTTFTLGTTGSNLGTNRLRYWDNAMFWAVAGNSVSGTHDISIVGKIGGKTFTIATSGTGGALSSAGQKLAIGSSFHGPSVTPTQILWTVVSAGGVSDARVVGVFKSRRGTMTRT